MEYFFFSFQFFFNFFQVAPIQEDPEEEEGRDLSLLTEDKIKKIKLREVFAGNLAI